MVEKNYCTFTNFFGTARVKSCALTLMLMPCMWSSALLYGHVTASTAVYGLPHAIDTPTHQYMNPKGHGKLATSFYPRILNYRPCPQTFGLFLLCLVFLSIPFVVQRIPSVISQTSNRSLKELVFFVWKLNFGESTHIHIFIDNGINASIKISNSSEFEHGRDIRKMKSIVIDKPPRTCQCIDNIGTFFPTY